MLHLPAGPNQGVACIQPSLADAHGQRRFYQAGCRCLRCRSANSSYESTRRAERRRSGESGPRAWLWVSADKARSRILELRKHKVGYRQVAKLAGLHPREILEIVRGRRTRITPATEAAILAVRAALARGQIINGWREHRLLHSLLTEGFPAAEIARRLGYRTPKLQLHRCITVANALRIRTLYERVNAEGPEVPELRTLAANEGAPGAQRRRGDRPAVPRRFGRPQTGRWYWFDPIYGINHLLVVAERDQVLEELRTLVSAMGFADDFRPVAESLWFDALNGRIHGCAGRFVGAKRNGYTVGLCWFPPEVDLDTLAHELFHATAFALTRAGVAFSDESEEAFAYYLGWLMRETRDRVYGKAS